jgi:hypothetical protein
MTTPATARAPNVLAPRARVDLVDGTLFTGDIMARIARVF